MTPEEHTVPFATNGLVYHHTIPPATREQWILVDGPSVVTGRDGTLLTDPAACRTILADDPGRFMIGYDHRGSWYAVPISGSVLLPDGYARTHLRSLYGIIPDDLLGIASRAVALSRFFHTHRFCGICGAKTNRKEDEIATVCPACGYIGYPVINPVVIVCIRRDDRILLARSPRFLPAVYGVIAGFVEAGETLEQAVAREVAEEVGIAIDTIRYRCSQPWPFPHSLMVGFTALYAGGRIRIDPSEIEEAGWYSHASLPTLPAAGSITRILIDQVVEEISRDTKSSRP
ncbi:MAG TPA: NAD(+) diphosphatase [Methanoregulaceae archaeon]|nr:NAD(+) diphosphatase [Methanoregulaceae archaeon]